MRSPSCGHSARRVTISYRGIQELVASATFTILLGKNGAGKSTLLRTLDNGPQVKYVSPERGGTLKYDASVDSTMSNNQGWLKSTRLTNRFEQFRQQSAALFRNLELAILREIEKSKRGDLAYTFDGVLDQINGLLSAIKMVRSDAGFAIQSKANQPVPEDQISSGESELIALAIEVLVFSRSAEANKMLLLDEPDVHLHPDLQQRFIAFVEKVATDHGLRVVIATHSTAVIGAFKVSADLQIVPVSTRDQRGFTSFKRSAVCEEIPPIFGAHPLSTAFNRSPVVLVEGEDDKRVLEQVVRSGKGKFAMAPCVVGTVNEMFQWEDWLDQFLPVLYDNPKAFSLRDLDDAQHATIEDLKFVCRLRLNCYAIENLLLCDESLAANGHDAASFLFALQTWAAQYPDHPYTGHVQTLVNGFDNRRTMNVKDVRKRCIDLSATPCLACAQMPQA